MFTQGTAYAIRSLLLLGSDPDQPRCAAEIASELDIPANFLSKLLGHLRRCGILRSKKGRGGGFRLAVSPDEITLGRVVSEFEDPAMRQKCVLGLGVCSDDSYCPLHERWARISSLVDELLSETTLAALLVAHSGAGSGLEGRRRGRGRRDPGGKRD